MKVLIVGGEGFIGQALLSRLLGGATIAGRVSTQVTVLDQRIGARQGDTRVRYVEGEFGAVDMLSAATDGGVDYVFHLASVPGGAAEVNFDLGMQVNLDSTRNLLDVLRRLGSKPTLVFASSIGIYGVPLPTVINEQTAPVPTLSYGMQKLVGELLVADYGRRGFVDGRSVRIPGIVARPAAKGMLSLFMSDLIRELSAGRDFVCPVSPQGTSWFMSRPCLVDNLLHAASLPAGRVAAQRTWLLPVLRASMAELVDAISRVHGPEVRNRVSYKPDAQLEAQFASYPPLLCPGSVEAGFCDDGTLENLVTRALETF